MLGPDLTDDSSGGANDATIGERIRSLRGELDLSQGELADRLRKHGLPWSQGTLSKVENGDRPVRLAEAPMLAAALGIEIEDLAAGPSRLGLVLRRAQFREQEAVNRWEEAINEAELARSHLYAIRLLNALSKGGQGPYVVQQGSVYDFLWVVRLDPERAQMELRFAEIAAALHFTEADFACIPSDIARWIEDEKNAPDYFPPDRSGRLPDLSEERELLIKGVTVQEMGRIIVEDYRHYVEHKLTEGRLARLILEHYPQVTFNAPERDQLGQKIGGKLWVEGVENR